MGSKCCKQKEDSPGVSLGKVLSRCTRIFPHSGRTVKINEYDKRERPIVSDPVFISSTNEERNHVTLLLPDAPRVPPRKKKPRLSKKRVSFQSDVDIMRMSSSKSLDSSTFEWDLGETKPRARSLDSLLAAREINQETPSEATLGGSQPLERRTSSLDHLPARLEDWPGMSKEETRLTAKLRRDTLGNALDIHSYRRPVLDTALEGHLEEESEDSTEDISSALSAKLRRDTLATISLLRKNKEDPIMENVKEEETDEGSIEDLAPSKLPLKIRRDTLGVALTLRPSPGSSCGSLSDSVYHSTEFVNRGSIVEEVESSYEDLAKKMSHSKLCQKLRRDTFGDALKQAVHNKTCSSFEDITDLEIHGAESCWCDRKPSTNSLKGFQKVIENQDDSVYSGVEKLSDDKQNDIKGGLLKDVEKDMIYIDDEQNTSKESLEENKTIDKNGIQENINKISNDQMRSVTVEGTNDEKKEISETQSAKAEDNKVSTSSRRKEWLNSILSDGESLEDLSGSSDADKHPSAQGLKPEESTKLLERNNNNHTGGPVKKVLFTEAELTTALRNMRTSPKGDQPYTLVYASPNLSKPKEVPIISVTPASEDAQDETSLSESLKEFETSIYDMLQTEEENTSNTKITSLIPS